MENAIASLAGVKPEIEPHRLGRRDLKVQRSFFVDRLRLPEIDVSIVTYHSRKWLDPFFASLVAQNYPLEKIHLIVTDHSVGADEIQLLAETLEPLRGRFASCSIERRDNKGFGAGHNRALIAGQSDYLLITNIDLSFEADTLTRLVTEAVTAPGDVASWECRQKPYEHPKAYNILTQETTWSSAACLLVRRSAFAEVNGFDDAFFMYGEDVDLSGRLRAGGWKLRYVPRAVVWHYTYGEPGIIKETQYFHGALGNFYLRLRYGSVWDISCGVLLQLYLLVHRQKFASKSRKLVKNYQSILKNARHFLSARHKGQFKFGHWDYAPQRDGAFIASNSGTDEPKLVPLVSLIVRTYPGRLPLLKEALRSIELQTYRPLEVIVVEDGGATAADICAALGANSDLNIVYYSAPHRGRCHSGNIGLELARGNFIGFLDDDDLLFADHVEMLVAELLKGKSQAAYAYAWEVETSFPADGGWMPYKEKPPRARLNQAFDRARLWRTNYIPIQAVLFDRVLYQSYGGFAEELENLEDWDLWQRYALEGDFACVEKTTSIYRTPADPAVRRARMQKIHDYYPVLVERQARMPFRSTVGELRKITGGDDVLARNRLIEKIARVPVVYRLGRWVRGLL